MQLSHAFPVRTVVFDEPCLLSRAGLVPAMALARRGGLAEPADRHVTVAGGPGHAAGLKVSALVAGMVAGADSIADMAVLRHGGMGRLFTGVRAPSTLGPLLRAMRFGHVRQLDAVAARFLAGLSADDDLVAAPAAVTYVDMDDTMRRTYGYAKQQRIRLLEGFRNSSQPASAHPHGPDHRANAHRARGIDGQTGPAGHQPCPPPENPATRSTGRRPRSTTGCAVHSG